MPASAKPLSQKTIVLILGIVLCLLFAAAYLLQTTYAMVGSLVLAAGAIIWAAMVAETARLNIAVREFAQNGSTDLLRGLAESEGEEGEVTALLNVLESEREEIAFSKGAVKAVGNPMLVCGKDGIIRVATDSLLTLLHKKKEQVVGKTVSQAFYNKDGESVTEEVIGSGRNLEKEVEITLWDGRVLPVKLYTNLIEGTDGQTLGAVSSFVDLSTVKEQQKRISEQNEKLTVVAGNINELAQRVASASEELSASADEQAAGAQRQKDQTDTVATSMEEMAATVLEVAQNATATSEAAGEARDSARQGVDLVGQAVAGINAVSDSAARLAEDLAQLDSQSGEIGRIIGVINDIADQTNLLALNAAIEAARAGEAGRGFAVVADEVRKLAEKTMTATKEVEDAIRTIQNRSQDAMQSMEATQNQVRESTDLSNQAGESLQQIMERIEDMVQRISQIATAAEEQSSAAEEINSNVEEIAQIAREADEGAGQAASATRDLAELAAELLSVSAEFQGDEKAAEANKLRKSKADMKGVLLKIAQEFVSETYGEKVYGRMQEELGHPTFLPTQSYPDQTMMQMAETVVEAVDIDVREFFIELGKFSIRKFAKMYPRFFKDESLKDFLMRMNKVHAQLTKEQPGITPPKFTYEDKGDTLFMNYHSKRGLFDYFEGIILGAAEYKGQPVEVTIKPLDQETARAEITFL